MDQSSVACPEQRLRLWAPIAQLISALECIFIYLQFNRPMTFSIVAFFYALSNKLLEEDKRLHMTWSFWLTLFALFLWPAIWAIATVFLIGFAKECWDSRFGTGFCVFDLLANFIGSTFALTFSWLLPGTLFQS